MGTYREIRNRISVKSIALNWSFKTKPLEDILHWDGGSFFDFLSNWEDCSYAWGKAWELSGERCLALQKVLGFIVLWPLAPFHHWSEVSNTLFLLCSSCGWIKHLLAWKAMDFRICGMQRYPDLGGNSNIFLPSREKSRMFPGTHNWVLAWLCCIQKCHFLRCPKPGWGLLWEFEALGRLFASFLIFI